MVVVASPFAGIRSKARSDAMVSEGQLGLRGEECSSRLGGWMGDGRAMRARRASRVCEWRRSDDAAGR